MRTSQPALVAELVKRDSANRAGTLVEPGQFLGRLPDAICCNCWAKAAAMPPEPVGSPPVELVRYGPGVVFAKVQFLRISAGQFGDVKRGRTCSHCWHFIEIHGWDPRDAARKPIRQ